MILPKKKEGRKEFRISWAAWIQIELGSGRQTETGRYFMKQLGDFLFAYLQTKAEIAFGTVSSFLLLSWE